MNYRKIRILQLIRLDLPNVLVNDEVIIFQKKITEKVFVATKSIDLDLIGCSNYLKYNIITRCQCFLYRYNKSENFNF